MKRLLLFSLVLSVYCANAQYRSVSFYMGAHPDDWQIFMGANAFPNIVSGANGSGCKVVVIYTTAGDGSFGNYPVNKAYYTARMTGANRSVQFCADAYSPHTNWDTSYFVVNTGAGVSKSILRMQYKNVVCYYLKLPDGCFEAGNINTLSKFAYTYGAHGYYSDYCFCAPSTQPLQAMNISAVDSTATYNSYEELKETIADLIQYESVGIPEISMNAQETDPDLNPGDHPDHIQTGALATDAVNMVNSCANLTLYEGYGTCNKPPNLTQEQISMEAALLSQVSYGRTINGFPGEWDPLSSCGHVAWSSRNYSRIIKSCDSSKVAQNAAYTELFPNPATSTINISYRVMEASTVQIALYDIAGRRLNLIQNNAKDIGSYLFEYSIDNLIPGNYIVYIKTSKYLNVLKFTKE